MHEIGRDLVYVLAAAAALTIIASGLLWWLRADRRVRRALRAALAGPVDADLVAGDRGAGFRLAGDVFAVVWDGGRSHLSYRLVELLGAELIIDDQVAARIFRGDARRPLDRVVRDAQTVCVRHLFDDARQPDFEITLWPSQGRGKSPVDVGDATKAANTWLARIEALVRRPAAQAAPVIRTEAAPGRAEEPDADDHD